MILSNLLGDNVLVPVSTLTNTADKRAYPHLCGAIRNIYMLDSTIYYTIQIKGVYNPDADRMYMQRELPLNPELALAIALQYVGKLCEVTGEDLFMRELKQ